MPMSDDAGFHAVERTATMTPRAWLGSVVARAVADPRLRGLVYELRNAAEFSLAWEHEKMLADRVRIGAYERGIADHVGPGDVVVDLGTGTGLLAFFAARRAPRRIYAIDHSPFIEVARQIAAHNRIGGIEFVQTHSRRFEPDEPVDVIVHEQFGDDLFNEHLLANLLDLKQRVLRPGGRILPARFALFVEPVCLLPEYRVPRLSEVALPGIEFDFLATSEVLPRYDRGENRFLDRHAFSHLLTEPTAVCTLDLDHLEAAPASSCRVRQDRRVVRDGVLSGFLVYFRVAFDAVNTFDTAPWSPPTSWGNRFLRVAQRDVRDGDRLDYELVIDDLADATAWQVAVASPRPASLSDLGT